MFHQPGVLIDIFLLQESFDRNLTYLFDLEALVRILERDPPVI